MTETLPDFYGAALRYAMKELGGLLNEVDSNPTLTTSVSTAVNGNGDRVGLVIVNLGANPAYVSITPDVSVTNGINLPPAGGSISMNVRDDFTLPSRQWFGITTGGNSAIYVLELVRIGQEALSQPK